MDSKKLTSQEILDYFQNEYKSTMELWESAATKFSDASLKLTDDMVSFVYKALTSMGLIAGFGFTGIQRVKNLYFFTFGELIMFSAIIIGIYKMKVFYKGNIESVDIMRGKIKATFKAHTFNLNKIINEIKEKEWVHDKQLLADYKLSAEQIPEIFDMNKDVTSEKDESKFINYMVIIFIIGFLLLIISYMPFWDTVTKVLNVEIR